MAGKRKRIPVGIDDFDELIRENYYYVDKSLFIKAIVEEDAKVLAIPRPRRFGKSLNLSMLKYFLTNKNAEKNRELFTGLAIENESDLMAEQGRYPVIHISFKDIKESTWEKCFEKTKKLIQSLYDEFEFLLESTEMSRLQRKWFENILLGEANQAQYENSLKLLSKLLHEYYGVKPYVLIDEYDQPIISAYVKGYFDEGISFFRNLYSAVLKDIVDFRKGLMTGILRISKESIFSGLNNITIDTILRNNYHYFGLNEGEVEDFLKYYGLDYELEEVKAWYNGYIFGKDLVYNPWSIISFVYEDELKPYWVNSSSNDLIKNMLVDIGTTGYTNLHKLIRGEAIEININENITFDLMESETTIFNLLLFSGYLSLTEEKKLRLVNREVREFYISHFETIAAADATKFSTLMRALTTKNLDHFKSLLQELFLTAVSYYDVGKEEKYYHNLILGFVFSLADSYVIKSNREYGEGRVDLLLKSKDGKLPDYAFEFKGVEKRDELDTEAQKALAQITQKQYAIELNNPVKMGIAFCGKKICIADGE